MITDSGRKAEGYRHEKLDCTVRTLALAAKITYSQAHTILKNAGRKDRHGCFDEIWRPIYLQHGFLPQGRPGMRVNTFLSVWKHPCILEMSGHVLYADKGETLDIVAQHKCRNQNIEQWYIIPAR